MAFTSRMALLIIPTCCNNAQCMHSTYVWNSVSALSLALTVVTVVLVLHLYTDFFLSLQMNSINYWNLDVYTISVILHHLEFEVDESFQWIKGTASYYNNKCMLLFCVFYVVVINGTNNKPDNITVMYRLYSSILALRGAQSLHK